MRSWVMGWVRVMLCECRQRGMASLGLVKVGPLAEAGS